MQEGWQPGRISWERKRALSCIAGCCLRLLHRGARFCCKETWLKGFSCGFMLWILDSIFYRYGEWKTYLNIVFLLWVLLSFYFFGFQYKNLLNIATNLLFLLVHSLGQLTDCNKFYRALAKISYCPCLPLPKEIIFLWIELNLSFFLWFQEMGDTIVWAIVPNSIFSNTKPAIIHF